MTPPHDAAAHASATHEIAQIETDLWVVRIPLHVRVEPVNAYVLRDTDGGLVIVDTGIALGADEIWRDVVAMLGATPSDIKQIVVTHHHPDHIGGSGALYALTGAPLLATGSTIEQAPDVWGDAGRLDSYFAAVGAHLHEHGLPNAIAAQLEHEREIARHGVQLPPDDAWRVVEDGDVITGAGREWSVVAVPGHADGQLVLHAASDGMLISADHVLERISPAVGRFPRHAEDPLGNYLASLARVRELTDGTDGTDGLVLPGHGMPFRGAPSRCTALIEHHEGRIEQCVEACGAEAEPTTAWQVANRVFAHVFARDTLNPADARFATTETLAHLEHARWRGRVSRLRSSDGLMRYWRIDS